MSKLESSSSQSEAFPRDAQIEEAKELIRENEDQFPEIFEEQALARVNRDQMHHRGLNGNVSESGFLMHVEGTETTFKPSDLLDADALVKAKAEAHRIMAGKLKNVLDAMTDKWLE